MMGKILKAGLVTSLVWGSSLLASEQQISLDDLLNDLDTIQQEVNDTATAKDHRVKGYTCYASDVGWEEHGAHVASGLIEPLVRARAYYECKRFHGECTVNCRRNS